MEDEILKEMWRIKDELSARFKNLDEMFRYYKQREREGGRKYVTLNTRLKKGRPARGRA